MSIFGQTAFGELAFGELPTVKDTLSGEITIEVLVTGDLSAQFIDETPLIIDEDVTGLYIDLLIINNDLTLSSIGEPVLVVDRKCIAQDIKHLIRESGLMVRLVGERNGQLRASLMQDLTLLIEDDARLVPGTIEITASTLSRYFVSADTVDFGQIDFFIGL